MAQRMVGQSVEAMGMLRRAIDPSGHRFGYETAHGPWRSFTAVP